VHTHLRTGPLVPRSRRPQLTTSHPLLIQALELATACINLTSPNPRVGCVIASTDGKVLGQGHTQRAGGAHAEIVALQDAQLRGHAVRGATAYVTLEPCSHQGRTGPCCDALVRAGIARVVACGTDPNPQVAGQGFARLRAAGVAVEVLPVGDPLAQAARTLNIGFFSRMLRKTPWVRMKVAASLDGTSALPNGTSQWITSPEARADGHAWRARACAVLTGVGTVLQDRPRLDVRLVPTPRQPQLVVVDSRLQTPADAALFNVADRQVTLYAAAPELGLDAALEARGASIVRLPGHGPDGQATGKVDLAAMLADLAQREVNELHVEAGHQLNGSLLRAGLVDELLVYLAPSLLGEGAPMASFGPLAALGQALPLQFTSVDLVGPDLRIRAGVAGRDVF
jgi:diaminohydroxyphosphoribosylaminopyrimidine deaminase/5-amino-6-(5-phosphoribosylamino)uracil reductase